MTARRMKAAERQLRVREMLERAEFVELAALCRRLQASPSTVRRDLIELEREGVLKRVHGGALASDNRGPVADLRAHSARMAEEKERIAQATAAVIQDGQTLILDGGSTVAAVARRLLDRSLQVITNSLPIAHTFREAPRIELTLTGGHLYQPFGVLLGPLCERMLSAVAADVLIMGVAGITETGFSNNHTLIVGSELGMIQVARRVIIVADHTKFGRSGMVPLAPLDAADLLVTDRALDPPLAGLLRSRGVKVVVG